MTENTQRLESLLLRLLAGLRNVKVRFHLLMFAKVQKNFTNQPLFSKSCAIALSPPVTESIM